MRTLARLQRGQDTVHFPRDRWARDDDHAVLSVAVGDEIDVSRLMGHGHSAKLRIVGVDQSRWDYKHQVLANRHVPAWRAFLWIKLIEVLIQAQPKALVRTYVHPDPAARHGMRWSARIW